MRLTGLQRIYESVLILGWLAAIYVMIALLSFDPADPSWSQTGWHGPVHNLMGATGAFFADSFFFIFGSLAYPMPFLIALALWIAFKRRDPSERIDFVVLGTKVIGVVLLVLTSCGLADLNFDDFSHFSSGGVVGDVLSSLMLPLFNQLGTVLVLLFCWAAGFTLFSGISWLTLVDRVGSGVLNLAAWLVNLVRGDQTITEKSVARDTQDSDFAASQSMQLTDFEALAAAQQASRHTSVNRADVAAASQVLPVVNQHQSVSAEIAPATEYTSAAETAVATPNRIFPAYDDAPHYQPEPEASAETRREPVISWPQTEPHEMAPMVAQRDDTVVSEAVIPEMSTASAQATAEVETDTKAESQTSVANSVAASASSWSEQNDAAALEQPTQSVAAEPAPSMPTDLPWQVDPETVDTTKVTAPDPIPAAQQHMAAEQHPFLMKSEPNLPKPTTPLPTLDLLDRPDKSVRPISREDLEQTARLVEAKLADYKISAEVVGVYPGPVITRFELDLAPGVKASRISNLSRDLARSLSAMAVRVVEVIPGKPYVGIELPNVHRETVYLSEVVGSERFEKAESPLAVVLGKDIAGESVVADLAKMPHLLVAGTTGSGKSVGVNVMILSMLYKATPEDVRFIMIDPKMLELSVYEGIPHLLTEVVTDMKDAGNALRWCVGEMERRYKLMSALGVRNIKGFNTKLKEAAAAGHPIPDPLWQPGDSMDKTAPMLEKLPFIVVIVDEFADLMMVVGKKVEELIARLAQKARAAGIHLVLATQRPSVDVITGLIKANIPSRIAFTVSTKIDSRTVLDQGGAESLLGMGDMLYLPPGSGHTVRVHGAFVDDHEVHNVVNDWKARGKPQYIDAILSGDQGAESLLPGESGGEDELDPLFDQVAAFVAETRRGSVSGVQRKFRIGYNRASRIVEQLEAHGIVSPPGVNGNREVLAPTPPRD
ncbi:hypothetical protein VST7929_00970 [Vibrio stylophorae]|uniref:DNA translocase FtsK n=1 Tax=Vibrio stylophorae TaxID=659351 RepID=A0ABN8DR46_9VIBR|nr:DNA translocase FtsK 4TM domain-containing protein [Vibrio stylophorae]CAH0533117.1 hypothetical protein VST7929_00970 [Vibrio stylophorae]